MIAVTLSGCLPLLVGSARTLRPGEYTIAMAGMGRTRALPPGVEQGGPAAGVVEGRAGLPGGRLESGATIVLPWHAAWDVKYALIEEERWLPAAAFRAQLGVLQPSFGGALLVTKTLGPAAVTLQAGLDHANERLWRPGSNPLDSAAETFYKNVASWGVGLEHQVSPVHSLVLNLVTWNATGEREAARADLARYGAREGRTWYASAGLRIRWTPPRRKGGIALTALRGRVMAAPADGRFTEGQPGVYQATVLLDVHTRVTSGGRPVPLAELSLGRAVLISGLALPQPHAFLARTIELQ